MPEGLKIQNKQGDLLYDSAWIEGVDYHEEEFNDEDYDEENKNESGTEEEDELDKEQYDEIDPNELTDILQEPVPENANDDNINEEEEEVDNEIIPDQTDTEEDAEESDDSTSEEDDSDEESVNPNTVTRSGRVSKPVAKLNLFHSEQQVFIKTQPIATLTNLMGASEKNTQRIMLGCWPMLCAISP
eukprot:scaffold31431_cov54-Attheya_sp.AAC.5